MKTLWLFSVRSYLRLALFFYFKKITTRNKKAIPEDEAVMFLGNHQNALIDALLIATQNNRFSFFLTRAAVFNNPLVGKILESLQMLPVYRIRDGWGNLNKNTAIFSKSASLLSEGQAIVVFPEGNHSLRRTVRPLSKGFTRVIFETLERFPKTMIHLIPVGLNFQNATQYGDTALINFGKPIIVGASLLQDRNNSVVNLKKDVSQELRLLTTHIDSQNYNSDIAKLEALRVDFTAPEAVNKCVANNFEYCEKAFESSQSFLKKIAKLILIIQLFVPYLIWKKFVQPKIKEIEFTSTFRFAVVLTVVPIFILLVMLILAIVFGLKCSFIYVISVILSGLLSVKL